MGAQGVDDLRKPVLPGKGATDYERYLRTDELLALQKPVEELAHPDELIFQVVHQSSEVLMKGSVHDLTRAKQAMDEADFGNASRLIRRANKIFDHTIELLRVLEMLTPYDYHIIRAQLGHGSGLDSPGFLALLHLAPRLAESFAAQVKVAGLTLEELYRRHHQLFNLHELAEQLLDFDERMQVFRFLHLKLAERIIGPGVIGTSGVPVEILKQRLQHNFFQELWDVRNDITNRVNEERQKQMTGHGEQ